MSLSSMMKSLQKGRNEPHKVRATILLMRTVTITSVWCITLVLSNVLPFDWSQQLHPSNQRYQQVV